MKDLILFYATKRYYTSTYSINNVFEPIYVNTKYNDCYNKDNKYNFEDSYNVWHWKEHL